MKRILLLLVTALLSCAKGARVSDTARAMSRFDDTPFLTTFWCGPPLDLLDDEQAKRIRDAGFNVIAPPCEGERTQEKYLHALEVAKRHGLLLWIADYRTDAQVLRDARWESLLDSAVAQYGHHSALGGYLVYDEPTPSQIDAVASVVARLKRVDAERMPYVNLPPDYLFDNFHEYRAYVENFVRTVRPNLLSYDYYPFLEEGDRSSFFESLSLFREVALREGIPFLLIVQAMPHGNYRDPTEAELAWQVHHAIAYGARGISYFAYWTPVNVGDFDRWRFRHGLIENGERTKNYYAAAKVNAHARVLVKALEGFHSVAITQANGEVSGPLLSVDSQALTLGLFEDARGNKAVLLVNRDYKRGQSLELRLTKGAQLLDVRSERFVDTGEWLKLPLAPGAAALIRTTSSN